MVDLSIRWLEDPARLNVGIEGADTWMPAETDVSIRPGWYWTSASDTKVKSADELLNIYYESVGRNTNLLLNFPVDSRGLVHENDANQLRQLATILRATIRNDYAVGQRATATNVRGGSDDYSAANLIDLNPSTYWATDDSVLAASAEIELHAPTVFNQVVLQEHIQLGQRVPVLGMCRPTSTVGGVKLPKVSPLVTNVSSVFQLLRPMRCD